MKKVIIMTWINGQNYGTLLQVYCLQEILKNISSYTDLAKNVNMDVEVLNYAKENNIDFKKKVGFFKQRLKNLTNRSLNENFHKIIDKFKLKKLTNNLSIREKKFNDFRENFLKIFPENVITKKEDLKNLPDFDLYVIGSDQVWNPKMLDDAYLLNWVSNKKLKISYAPSLCVNELNSEELKKYKELKNFQNISIREYTNAADQISKLINKKITQVVDPVVLFGRDALIKLCHNSKENDYCFTYFLSDDKLAREYAIEFANSNKLELNSIIAVNQMHMVNDLILSKYAVWDADPFELINMIYNSKVVITDSFHMVVISVLLHKNFIVLEREKNDSQQNNRLINFLKNIGLEDKFGKKPDDIDNIQMSNSDWQCVDEKIEKLRIQSYKYLANALKPFQSKDKEH